jgi:hypothetical protein
MNLRSINFVLALHWTSPWGRERMGHGTPRDRSRCLVARGAARALDRLWERLGRSPDLFPLTEPQRREIDARSEELDRALAAGEPGGIPWDEVLRRIKAH